MYICIYICISVYLYIYIYYIYIYICVYILYIYSAVATGRSGRVNPLLPPCNNFWDFLSLYIYTNKWFN